MCCPIHRRVIPLALVVLVGLFNAASIGQTDTYWLNPVSGNWSDAANWSTDPVYPANDSPTTGDIYDVTIDVTGAAYTVKLDADITLNSLTLNSSDLTLVTYQDLNIAGTLNLQSGSFRPLNGKLSNAAIVGAADQTVRIASLDDLGGVFMSFDQVTTYVPIVVESGYNSNYLSIHNDLSLENTSLTINSNLRAVGAAGLTSSTTGLVQLNNKIQLINEDTTLTIGPNVTLRCDGYSNQLGIFRDGTIINQGVIHTEDTSTPAGYDRLTVTANLFSNEGLFEVGPNSEAIINANNWTNTGIIRLNGGTLTLGGNFTMADVGDLQRTGGTVNLAGKLDNTDQTLTLDAFGGGWQLTSALNTTGAIQGGQVAASGDQELIVAYNASGGGGGHLIDVDVHPDVRVLSAGALYVDGSTRLLSQNLTVEGSGSVAFENDVDNLQINFVSGVSKSGVFFSASEFITLGPSTTIHANGGHVDIGRYSYPSTIINQGTILIDQADSLVTLQSDFRNEGVIELSAGQLRLGDGAIFDNLGTVKRTSGHIILNGSLRKTGGTLAISAEYGTIELGQDAVVQAMTITTADGERLVAAETGASIEDSIIAGNLAISAGAKLTLENCQLSNGNISLEGIDNSMAELVDYGGYAMIGAGNIIFNGSDNANRISFHNVGENVTIRTGASGGHLHNGFYHGDLVIDNPDATVYLERDFYNEGTITMSAGTLVISGEDWSPTQYSSSQFHASELGDVQVTGGRVWITTKTLFLDDDLNLDKLGSVEVFDDVEFGSGNVVSTGDHELIIRGQNVNFSGTYIDADVRVEAGGSFTSFGTFAEDRRLTLLGHADRIASGVAPSHGETIFNGSDNANTVYMGFGYSGTSFKGVIRTGTTGGTIQTTTFGPFAGSIIADTPGATITISTYGSFWNVGNLQIGPDAEVNVEYLSSNPPYSPVFHQSGGTTSLQGGTLRSVGGIGVYNGGIQGNGLIIGDVLFSTYGTLAPGFSAGMINIQGNLSMTSATAAVKIELGGTTPESQHDQVAITGDVALGGVMELSLLYDYQPNAGDVFEVMIYGGQRAGKFDHVDAPGRDVLGDLALAVLYDDDIGGVDGAVMVRASLIGDANVDDHVNIADLVLLSQNYSRVTDVSWADGDFNQDGAIDIADLVLLSQHYSQSVIVSGTAALAQSTPEPGAAGMLLMVMLGCRRRRRC